MRMHLRIWCILSGEFMISVTHGFTWHLHTTATTEIIHSLHTLIHNKSNGSQCRTEQTRKEHDQQELKSYFLVMINTDTHELTENCKCIAWDYGKSKSILELLISLFLAVSLFQALQALPNDFKVKI